MHLLIVDIPYNVRYNIYRKGGITLSKPIKPDSNRFEMRIDPEIKAGYMQWCKENGTDASDDLRRYMTSRAKLVKKQQKEKGRA